jgi:ABC-2 type transport system permease protein
VLLGTLGGLLVWGLYRGSLAAFSWLRTLDEDPTTRALLASGGGVDQGILLGVVITERAVSLALVALATLVLFSNLITALSTLYLAEDLKLLMALPSRQGAVFAAKFVETFIASSLTVVIFVSPVLIGLGVAWAADWRYYLTVTAVLPLLFLIPTALGTVLVVILMRVLPARRTREITTAVSVLFGAMAILAFRFVRPEGVFRTEVSDLARFVEGLTLPASPILPSTWAQIAITEALEGRISPLALPLGLAAACGALLATTLARLAYHGGWVRADDHQTPIGSARYLPPAAWERWLTRLGHDTAAFLVKDIRVFSRDPAQWSQVLLLGALIALYLFSVSSLPIESRYFRSLVGYLNLAFVGFVLAAVGLRFAFPAASQERAAEWLVRSAPISYSRMLWAKFGTALIPLLTLAQSLTVISGLMLEIDAYIVWLTAVAVVIMTVALTALGVGLGAIYQVRDPSSPAEVSVSSGGLLYMVLALGYSGLTVVMLALPAFARTNQQLGAAYFLTPWGLAVAAGVLALAVIVTIAPMTLGARALSAGGD